MFRSKPLRDTAIGMPCTIQLPVCKNRTDTTVWVHSDELEHGKGKAEKAHDAAGAWGCCDCHEALPKLPRAQRVAVMRAAIIRTVIQLFERGMVVVASSLARREPLPANMKARQKFSEATARPSKSVDREPPSWRRG